MAINTGKWLTGGVAAGVVMAVCEIAVNKLALGAKMVAEMNAFKAGSGDEMIAGNNWWLMPLVMDVICGILLIWLYAAIRSRFGPGQKTAIYAAVYFWIVAGFFTMGMASMGMMSWGLWTSYSLAWLVIAIIGASVGARLYSEDGATV